MIDQSNCTIIIPHLGANPEEEYAIEQCTRSLIETVPQMKFLIAKNGPKQCVHSSDIWINTQGQCRAVNAAVAITNTEWIFVTNSDMIYSPGWWERLTAPLPNDLVLCVSPQLVEPRPGAPTFQIQPFGGAGGDFDRDKWLLFAKDYMDKTSLNTKTGLRSGFNLPFLIKRELWDTIGGYDIAYDPFGSNGDSDLEYKIKLAGVQSYQNIDSIVYHFSQTTGTFHPDNRGFWEKNFAYFITKWGFERIGSPKIWDATFEIPMDVLKYKPEWINKYKHA